VLLLGLVRVLLLMLMPRPTAVRVLRGQWPTGGSEATGMGQQGRAALWARRSSQAHALMALQPCRVKLPAVLSHNQRIVSAVRSLPVAPPGPASPSPPTIPPGRRRPSPAARAVLLQLA
jgi:hypothetical protein